MIIDLDTCAEADIIAGLMKPKEDENTVLFYSDKYTRRDTIKLINATGENLVVTRMEDIHNYIRLQMNQEYFYNDYKLLHLMFFLLYLDL